MNIDTTDWITILQENGNCHFTAHPDGDINEDVDFKNIEPIDESALLCATNAWPVYIICQWDQEEGREISADEVVNGDLLKTPSNCEELVDNDEDTYTFRPTCENYCIEISNDSEVSVYVYPRSAGCPSESISFSNTFSKCTIPDMPSGSVRRFYKSDWIKNQEYIIKIKSLNTIPNYYGETHPYSFSVKKVRPLILIHGIIAHPLDALDKETTFGDLPKHLNLCADSRPVKVFDFPWDPGNNHYTMYCNTGCDSLNYYINQNCTQKYDLKPVIMAHSMGGILTVAQMGNVDGFVNTVDKYIFCGTPFCGADKANYSRMLPPISYALVYFLVFYIDGLNNQNLNSLRRGTDEVWTRMEKIPTSFKDKEATYFLGSTFWKIAAGEDSDIVVSKSSANLSGTLELNQNVEHVNMFHCDLKTVTFPYSNEYDKLMNCLFQYLND